MAVIKYNNVGLTAISACVPPKVFSNHDLGYMLPEDTIEKNLDENATVNKKEDKDEQKSS